MRRGLIIGSVAVVGGGGGDGGGVLEASSYVPVNFMPNPGLLGVSIDLPDSRLHLIFQLAGGFLINGERSSTVVI